jgi:hypothetical protein
VDALVAAAERSWLNRNIDAEQGRDQDDDRHPPR